METPTPTPKLKVGTSFSKRDLIIGLIAGAIMVGFILFAIGSMHDRTGTHGVRGIIKEKEFIERPEQRITVGRDGIHIREREGDYLLHVWVESEEKMYYVQVNRFIYESKEVGQPYYFSRPPRMPD